MVTSREEKIKRFKRLLTHPVVVLGDSRHGKTSIELLEEYREINSEFKVDRLFVEGFIRSKSPLDSGKNIFVRIPEIMKGAYTKSMRSSDIKMLKSLAQFCGEIHGLETEECGLLAGVTQDNRCHTANPIWSMYVMEKIDVKKLKDEINIICVGTSHTVSVLEEVDGTETRIKPIEERLKGMAPELEGKVVTRAVVDSEIYPSLYIPVDNMNRMERIRKLTGNERAYALKFAAKSLATDFDSDIDMEDAIYDPLDAFM